MNGTVFKLGGSTRNNTTARSVVPVKHGHLLRTYSQKI